MLINKSLTILATLLLAACAPHISQTAPPIEMPKSFPAANSVEQVLPEQWWVGFEDPDLNRLMKQLFSANLDLVQAHARLQQSEALLHQVRAGRYPNVMLAGQTGRSSQPGMTGDNQGESSQLSVSAGFELDLFGKLKAKSHAALLTYQASQNDLQSLYMSLSAQLADLYYLATEQRAQLALTDNTIASQSNSLLRIEERYRQGVAAVVDLYQARQNLAATKAKRLSNEQSLALAENALAVLLGDFPGQLTLLAQSEIPAAPPQLPAGLPADLLKNRPDIRSALLRVEARDAEVAAAIADRFPTFNLSGTYGGSRSDVTGSLISGDFWSLLVNLSQPLFDGGRRKAEVERKRSQFTESVAAYQETVLRSFQEVDDALSGNRTTEARIARLTEQVDATSSAQRLALDRYLSGLTDYLPVLTAEVFHFNARSQLLTAKRQLLSQRISLARALGGNWMAEQLTSDHQHIAEQVKNND